MNERERHQLIASVVVLGTFVGIAVFESIQDRKLKKEGKSLLMRNESLKIHRETVRWIAQGGKNLDTAEFNKQLNEKIDFANFIANH